MWAVLFLTAFAGVSPASAAEWISSDVGSTGVAGTAVKDAGVWTVRGAGSDIWGTEDSFQYLHKPAAQGRAHIDVRLDDLSNTHPFAKAGLMVRGSLDPNAAAVILSVKPNNEIEFMHRPTAGAQMIYDGGTVVSLPVWLQLSWNLLGGSDNGQGTYELTAAFSPDGRTWTTIGRVLMSLGPPCCASMEAGVAVLSHDPGQLNTAHFEGLSMLHEGWSSTDIGNTGIRGSASDDPVNLDSILTVDGAGADIWGRADSFQFVHQTVGAFAPLDYQVLRIDNTHQFAKAGLMFRDGLAPDAVNVILDVKPDGGVEFMARTCTGCETQYLGGTTVSLPIDLDISRVGNTFYASVGQYGNPASRRQVGSVTLAFGPTFEFGFAVTSHDVGRLTTAAFDHPPQ